MPPSPSRTRAPALATATALVVAALTGVSAQAAEATVGPDGSGGVVVDAGYLRLGMNATGQVTSLVDRRTARNHLATGQGTAPLVSLVVGGRQVTPSAVTLGQGNTLRFTNSAAGIEIDVALQEKAAYTTLEVTDVVAPQDADVQTLLWGPLATGITQTLGESVGVVRDSTFAVGLKPLTDRTEGGWPREDTAMGWQSQVSPNPSRVQVAPLEEWSVGARTSWGTLLRAFTFDYTKKRDRLTGVDGGVPYPIPVGPLADGRGSVVGSKIALFGTAPDLAPTVLSNIATDQGLPYPTINGQWQKTAQATSKSILIVSDLNAGTVDQAARFAKDGGMDMVYALGGSDGPWQSDGHYAFDGSFGGNDTAAKALVDRAKASGVQVGTHTLSDFISWYDSYASPSLSPDVTIGQSAPLSRPAAAGDTEVHLASCAPLAAGAGGTRFKIGDEVADYSSYSQAGGECKVTGVHRGIWGSSATSHPSGTAVTRLPANGYGGALGGLPIIDDIATRFATIWDTTGITGMSFDGLESASQSGWGGYGLARLVNDTFRRQSAKDGFISETSRMSSNTWDGLSRASWGELVGTDINQLYVHNAYYQDNYLPGMLGWIALPGNRGVADLEDTLARAASWNAGSGFRTSVGSLASGPNTAKLLDAVKQWDAARNLGAFTTAQLASFRDQSTHWHLSVITPGKAWSLQQLDGTGRPVGGAQPVTAPTPAFTTTSLPAAITGSLYEARVVTNNPSAIRYTVTSGALPAGLTLNPDTGGITGIPSSDTAATFTVTAKGALGTADAVSTFTIAAATGPITSGLAAGKCLDDYGNLTTNGSKLNLWDCNGSAAQSWTAAGDGSLRVNGKCMDVDGGGTANGVKVQIWDCNGTGAQVWRPQPDGALLNPQSGRCLDVPRADPANGIQLQIYDCNGTPAQKWTLPV
ncbi:ricin-type beta-trefoil lectin domain protein [Kitasatospora xanthocidica]|uniref:ricin-type beta-trefoil lectin domain protein n=1 Tax=Kitasatospora xanthocidica TaxID=83382 RepID=UPI0036EF86AB